MWLDWSDLEDTCVTPMRSAYRVVNIERVATWDQPSILKNPVCAVKDDAGETKQLCDVQLEVDRIQL